MSDTGEVARLRHRISLMEKEETEMRDLSVQLAKTVQALRGEREAMERSMDDAAAKITAKDLLLHDCMKGLKESIKSLKRTNATLAEAQGPQSPSRRAANGGSLPGSPSGWSANSAASDAAALTKETLGQLLHESETSYQLACDAHEHFSQVWRPESDQVNQLRSHVAYLKSKLDKQAHLDIDNARLRRVLRTMQKQGARVQFEEGNSSDTEEPPSPSQVDHVQGRRARGYTDDDLSLVPPTVIRMPGYTEHRVNSDLWPVRSVGVQCTLLTLRNDGTAQQLSMNSYHGYPQSVRTPLSSRASPSPARSMTPLAMKRNPLFSGEGTPHRTANSPARQSSSPVHPRSPAAGPNAGNHKGKAWKSPVLVQPTCQEGSGRTSPHPKQRQPGLHKPGVPRTSSPLMAARNTPPRSSTPRRPSPARKQSRTDSPVKRCATPPPGPMRPRQAVNTMPS
ncbi:hypothetical protein DIPPA_24347 [Diplonema papillatum]|nr:hypothetical protein DIPPA_24347 [Diplonema papillatum]